LSRLERMTKLGADVQTATPTATQASKQWVQCHGCLQRMPAGLRRVVLGGFDGFGGSGRIGGGVQWLEWAGGGEGGRAVG